MSGDGTNIRGNVGAERDFVGRDSTSGNSGKGIQQVSVDLHNLSDRDLNEIVRMVPRLNEAMFGDGFRWVGVVKKLDELSNELKQIPTKGEVEAMLQPLLHPLIRRVEQLEKRYARPDNQNRIMMVVVLSGFILITSMVGWIVWILANGGAL